MNPIEKVHRMIASGLVLGPKGGWISRTEALKIKRHILKHIENGEVEINGKWIKLSEIDALPQSVFSLFSEKEPEMAVIPTHFPEERETESIPISPVLSAFPQNQKPPGFGTVSKAATDTSSAQRPHHLEPDVLPRPLSAEKRQTAELQAQAASPVASPQPSLSDQTAGLQPTRFNRNKKGPPSFQDLPPRQLIDAPGKKPETPDALRKETVTIRTIPLGKETSLTISESRVGGALVAICSIRGFIDQSNIDDFHNQLISMLEFGIRFFIIDLEQTTLVGSAGWGVLAVAARLIKGSDGLLLICSMKENIEESFRILQFDDVIEARKTMADCFGVIESIVGSRMPSTSGNHDQPGIFPHYEETYEELPLHEKIKTIIALNGPISFFKIASYLKQDRFGRVKINPVKLYFQLKKLNLDTRWKRLRYYRSC